MNVPIYIVSLQRDIQRRKILETKLNDIGVNYQFINAIDAKNPETLEIINKHRGSGGQASKMTDGEIACTLSHQAIYRKVIESQYEWFIVLEDDVLVDKRLNEFVQNLELKNTNQLISTDIYILGGISGLYSYHPIAVSLFNYRCIGNIKLRRITYNLEKLRRACCYLIHRSMAEKMLALSENWGLYRADSWKLLLDNGLVDNFYFSEFISHPILTEYNSNLEADRVIIAGKSQERTLANLYLKKIRSILRAIFFSLRF